MKRTFALTLGLCVAVLLFAQKSGNPILPGWYADPEGVVYGDTFWIYPTTSRLSGDDVETYKADAERKTDAYSQTYNLQTHFDAFSSKDLVHWTKHSSILTKNDVSWAKYAMWAPAALQANGKYYLFFSANDIQSNEKPGGIGVAVADQPEGPFRDALGKPLVSQIINGAQPIDQYVFRDDDGQFYMYYGGWKHCNMVKLSPDMLSIVPFEDGTTYKEITPENYVEGPFMLKKDGKYYFMWSEGGWTGPNYSVAYAIAESPFGPFKRIGKILEQDPDVATGAGHHSVVKVPDQDTYYIIYHRRPLGLKEANERVVCIDKLEFDEQGFIKPVKITFEGVEALP